MASYNNCHGNIVYSRFSRRLSKLLMSIVVSATSFDQRENILYIANHLRWKSFKVFVDQLVVDLEIYIR